MKEKDWKKQLFDRLSDYEETAPEGLWADIEARLATQMPQKHQSARTIPLWVKLTTAAAFAGVLTGNGYLMWQLGRDEMAKREAAQALEAPATPMKSENPKSDSPEIPSEGDAIILPIQHFKQTPLFSQDITSETEEAQAMAPEAVTAEQPSKEEQPIPSEKPVQKKPETLTNEQEQLRVLDAKIAEATKKRQRGQVSFGLYAQGGSGSQMSANGVLMSPTMAESSISSLATVFSMNGSGLTLSITTGLVYTRLRSEFVNIMAGTPLSKEQTLYYIGVPVNAQYKVWSYKGLSVYAAAGGQVDYNVKAHMEQEGVDYPVSHDGWQFSVQGSVGIEYDVIPQLGIYVEPGVKRYFNNGSSVRNFFKDKPTSLNLQVGLRVNLGK